ncbi:hypothetical protein EDC05_005954 [Coemansia umbellata]|uniref:Uncharacterized protein n=1 Tax=Coemansia umbellata TaxID=1424467 RepID=A0ABQ8PG47_9FUNG|nr:hypothetical protein EDC05_005954 [Coemansia umbellata]
MDNDDIYEVDRIIGRRISLANKTEHLVFWKSYDISDCTWEGSANLECPEAIAEFERRCLELRKARLKNPSLPPIDRYENDGMATLIDDALELIPLGDSAFQDAVADFIFSADNNNNNNNNTSNANGIDEASMRRRRSKAKPTATLGWHRMVNKSSASGAPACYIKNIRGSIRDSAGRIYYLTTWSDKGVTWEAPHAFNSCLEILTRHETARFFRERKELVKAYQKTKTILGQTAFISLRKPKFMLEKNVVHGTLPSQTLQRTDGVNIAMLGQLNVKSAAGSPNIALEPSSPLLSMSDSHKSNLLANQASSADPLIPPKPVYSSPLGIHAVVASDNDNDNDNDDDDDDDDNGDFVAIKKPIYSRADGKRRVGSSATTPKITRDKDSAVVFIDHSPGSVYKRYQQALRQKQPVMAENFEELLEDGTINDVTPSKMTVSTLQSTSTPKPQTDCAGCNKAINEIKDEFRNSCAHCDLSYHDSCYDKIIRRVGLADRHLRLAIKLNANFLCSFCSLYMSRGINWYLTWRLSSQDASDSKNMAKVDVLVKWKGFSFRHLDWVPFKWLNSTKRGSTLRSMKLAIQAGLDPWRLEDRFDKNYTIPDYIIGAKKAAAWLVSKRANQQASSTISIPLNAWDLYKQCESVYVVWKGLDISEATWEAPPDPTNDKEEYMVWYLAYMGYQRALMVSLRKHKMLLSGRDAVQNNAARLSFTTQPGFIKGGLLMDYQLTGVNWLLSRWIESKPAILADDMGMGKTIQVISFLSAIYHSTIPPDLKDMQAAISNAGTFPFLVIVPATLINNWMNEFKSWAPDLVVAQLSGRSAEREIQLKHTLFNSNDTHRKDLRCHVVLTSYEAISNLSGISVFAAHDFIWQAIILDEGHRLKNDQTKMYAILSRFKTRQRVLLTGTPLQNDVRELFSLVSFLDPDVFGNATSLHAKYSADTPEGIGQIKELIRPYILRRKKEDQLLLVPPKCELILPVSMTNLQRELYKATLSRNVQLLRKIATALHGNSATSDMSALVNATDSESEPSHGMPNHEGGAAPPKPTKSTKLSSLTNILMEIRRIVSHPYLIRNVEPNFPDEVERHMRLIDSSGKLKLLHALLPELQARGHRILLFAQFKDTLDILEDYLAGEGVRYERIDGDTLPSVRQTKVDAFNSPSSSSLVFMASTRTGGLGLNLTSADVVVIYDCDFNPHIDLQAMARAHRIGQRKPVTVFKFVVKDSAEERIVKAATRKLVLEHLIIQRMDDDSMTTDNPLQTGEIEQALRYGASLLFEPNAEADAESRAIKYDHAHITALLDRCEQELVEQLQKIEEEVRLRNKEIQKMDDAKFSAVHAYANSIASKFSRIWTLDDEGQIENLSKEQPSSGEGSDRGGIIRGSNEGIDIWSRLLETTGASEQMAEDIPTEKIGGRHLRVRKRKVDYSGLADSNVEEGIGAAGSPAKTARQKDNSEDNDDEFVMDISGHSDEEVTEITTLPPAQPAAVIVSQMELSKVVDMHVKQLIQTYTAIVRQKSPLDSASTKAVIDGFNQATTVSSSSDQPGTGTIINPPQIFFPIPVNMRLPQGVQLPLQQVAKPCWACASQLHSRGFCPRICDAGFISTIQRINKIPQSWSHPVYYEFIHWYTYQYLWFVLGHPKGQQINADNLRHARIWKAN